MASFTGLSVVFVLLFALGATMRLTRLITADYLTERPRHWLGHKLGATFNEFIHCPWCVSVWVGFGVAPLTWFYGGTPWFVIPAMALTFSYVTAAVASRVEEP